MDETSSGEKGEVGGTGDDRGNEFDLVSEGHNKCDACEGCDDVCNSKGIHLFVRC